MSEASGCGNPREPREPRAVSAPLQPASAADARHAATLRALAEAAPGVMMSFRQAPDGRHTIVYASPRVREVYGFEADEVREDASLIFARIHAEDRDNVAATIERSRVTMSGWQCEYRYLHPSRGEVWLAGRSSPTRDDDGGVTWHGFVKEVTQRRHDQAALLASNEKFRRLLELAPVGISIAENRRIVEANAAFLAMMRAPREEVIGSTYESIGTLDPALRESRLSRIEQTGSASDLEVVFRRRDGTLGHGITSASTVEVLGKVLTMMVTLDVSARKEMETRLQASDMLSRAVLRNIPGGYVTVVDRDCRFLLAEGTLLRTFPLPPLVGKKVADLLDPETAERSENGYRRALAGETFAREVPYLGHILMSQHVPLRDSDGTVYAALNLAIDITELRNTEQALRKLQSELEERVASRTAELGAANEELEAFTYSVSHDLRAPLRAVDGFSLAVLEDYGQLLPAEGQRYLHAVRDGAKKMSTLIDELLELSRVTRAAAVRGPVDTNALVHGCLADLAPMRAGREVELRIGELPPCLGDTSLLRQVWQNLLSNALKYTGKRAVAHVQISASRNPERRTVTYVVADDGAGFDMRYIGRLFGVFQRLHRQDEFEGTGVGLALSQRIVKRLGGSISGRGEPGHGATFEFTLPAVPDTDEEEGGG